MSALEKAKYTYDRLVQNRSRSGNHGCLRDKEKRYYVISKLRDEHWSPEIIAGKIGKDLPGKSVSAKTIYNFTKKEREDLKEYLRCRGKPYRQRVAHPRSRFKTGAPEKRSIVERPAEVEERREFGHWEADTMVTAKGGTKAVLTLIERMSRYRRFILIPDLKSATVQSVIRAFLVSMPEYSVLSITFDNGSEFSPSELLKLEKWHKELLIYYCEPYCPWQRGTVERAHVDFRWYVPKRTDFGTLAVQEVSAIEARLNRRPMRCLGFSSPLEILQEFSRLHDLAA